jgi:AAA family ATP:ADP antiporter
METLRRSVRRFVQAEPQELRPLAWSFGYFFCLLCGYYILRPVRDEMAIQGGVQNLPWMMTATFLTLLAVTPLFGWLSARYSRYRLLLAVYLFFITNLLVLYLLMTNRQSMEWVARGFFVWLSVFNLFVVSVFWSFMADLFTPAQGARLFGVIAAGGSTGALFGPLITTGLTYVFPVPILMLVSALFLAACIWCIYRLEVWSRSRSVFHRENSGEPLGGGLLAGVRLVWSSPYLLGICGYLTCLTMTATFLYFEQMRLVAEHFTQPEARTRFFSMLDLDWSWPYSFCRPSVSSGFWESPSGPAWRCMSFFRCFVGWGNMRCRNRRERSCSRSSVARKSIKRRTSSIRPFRAPGMRRPGGWSPASRRWA